LVLQVERFAIFFAIFSSVAVGENNSEHNTFCSLWCPYSLTRFIIPGVIITFLRHINTILFPELSCFILNVYGEHVNKERQVSEQVKSVIEDISSSI
jgi:hypothetical protein